MAASRLADSIRRRLRAEVGTIYKPHAGKIRFALAFPNTYYVGMSNLGFQIVYRLLNALDDVVCERVFLPDPSDLPELLRTGRPLVTMESQTPVRDFDVLGFSVSFELDYPNVVRMLSFSGLKPLIAERRRGDPLVIAGGPTVTFNPEPLAPFVDACCIGDAEELVPDLVDVVRLSADTRDAVLMRLSKVEGIYVSRFYEPEYDNDGTISRVHISSGAPRTIRRRRTNRLDPYPGTSIILTPETEFSNMILAEVARGCGRKCRFCVTSYTNLAPRARRAESVVERIIAGDPPGRSAPRVGLVGASVFDHPGSIRICRALVGRDRRFSISSTRADTLTADVVEVLHRGGQETLTIAPEAGTDRLRGVINKGISRDDIMAAACTAWDGGFRRLKLYFMVGLPTETDEDVDGIGILTREIACLGDWDRVAASVSCFVPKPWTPFQWAAMEDEKSLAEKVARVRAALRGVRCVQVVAESPREAMAQGVLSRGDRRVRDALMILASEKVSWRSAFRRGGVDTSFYAGRARSREEVFPWDHIGMGVSKEYLWREFERAVRLDTSHKHETGV